MISSFLILRVFVSRTNFNISFVVVLLLYTKKGLRFRIMLIVEASLSAFLGNQLFYQAIFSIVSHDCQVADSGRQRKEEKSIMLLSEKLFVVQPSDNCKDKTKHPQALCLCQPMAICDGRIYYQLRGVSRVPRITVWRVLSMNMIIIRNIL